MIAEEDLFTAETQRSQRTKSLFVGRDDKQKHIAFGEYRPGKNFKRGINRRFTQTRKQQSAKRIAQSVRTRGENAWRKNGQNSASSILRFGEIQSKSLNDCLICQMA